MLEYVWIYLNKQSSEYARILNVPDTVHKATVQMTEQLSRQGCIQGTVKHLRWSVLQKQ